MAHYLARRHRPGGARRRRGRRHQAEHARRQPDLDERHRRDAPRGEGPGHRLGRARRRVRGERRDVHHARREHRPDGARDEHRRRLAGRRPGRGHPGHARREGQERRDRQDHLDRPGPPPQRRLGRLDRRSTPARRRPARRSRSGAVDGIAATLEDVARVRQRQGRSRSAGEPVTLDLPARPSTEVDDEPVPARSSGSCRTRRSRSSCSRSARPACCPSSRARTSSPASSARWRSILAVHRAREPAAQRRRPAPDRARARPVRPGADRHRATACLDSAGVVCFVAGRARRSTPSRATRSRRCVRVAPPVIVTVDVDRVAFIAADRRRPPIRTRRMAAPGGPVGVRRSRPGRTGVVRRPLDAARLDLRAGEEWSARIGRRPAARPRHPGHGRRGRRADRHRRARSAPRLAPDRPSEDSVELTVLAARSSRSSSSSCW